MISVLAFDLGLNVGYALLQADMRPEAGSFRIPFGCQDLGHIAEHFESQAGQLFKQHKPDVVARAARFLNKTSRPDTVGVYFGLSMVLDRMAVKRNLPHYEVWESDARSAFLGVGNVPRKSKDIKAAVVAACTTRGWPAKDDHACDAIVVGAHVLSSLEPETAHQMTALFGVRA